MRTLVLVLTLITGISFQFLALNGQSDQFLWLLEVHRGRFGSINLELIYPVINGLGLLTFILTGLILWLNIPGRKS